MKSTALIATVTSSLLLAAPALAQDPPPPTGTPGGGPPQSQQAPPAQPDPEASPAPQSEPAQPAAAPEAPQTAPAPVVTAPPRNGSPARPTARKKRCSKKMGRAKYRKCKKAAKRKSRPTARKSAVYGYMGAAECAYTRDNTQFLFHSAPDVGSDVSQWVVYYNAYSLYMGGSWSEPAEWVGPFWQHTAYPGWTYFAGTWRRTENFDSLSQHWVPSGGRSNGVQWVKFHTTGEVAYQYTTSTNCQGTGGYFGQP